MRQTGVTTMKSGQVSFPPQNLCRHKKIAGLRLCRFVPVCAGLCRFVPVCASLFRFVSQFHFFAGEQIAHPLFLTVEKSWKK